MTDDLVKRLRAAKAALVGADVTIEPYAGSLYLEAADALERLSQQAESDLTKRLRDLANSCSNPHLYEKERTMLEAADALERLSQQAEPVAPKFWKAKGLDPCENCGQLWRTHTGGMWKCPDAAPPAVQAEHPELKRLSAWLCSHDDLWQHMSGSPVDVAIAVMSKIRPPADEAVRLLREARRHPWKLQAVELEPECVEPAQEFQAEVDAYLAKCSR